MTQAGTAPSSFAAGFVAFYRMWHGQFHLPGAGLLLRWAAKGLPSLRRFPLPMDEVGTAMVDFRDGSAFALLNYSLGELASDWSLLSAMAHVLKPGQVLWDVGANIGYVSQHFAQSRFNLRKIHAFEPNPNVCKTLKTLFEHNSGVDVHPVGLGERNEQREIRVWSRGSADGSLVRDLPGAISIPIEIRVADQYRRENDLILPDVIKIDVEGFEPQVFSGMRETISEARPIIFFEHIWMTEDAMRRCVPSGYDLTLLLDDGALTRDFDLRGRGHNAILTPTERTASLPAFVSSEGVFGARRD